MAFVPLPQTVIQPANKYIKYILVQLRWGTVHVSFVTTPNSNAFTPHAANFPQNVKC